MSILAPLLISIIGTFIWFLHWHGSLKSLNLNIFSSSFLLLSLFLWIQIKGAEFGVIYFIISLSIIGLIHLVQSKNDLNIIFILKNRHSNKKVKEITLKKSESALIYQPSKGYAAKNSLLVLNSIFNLLLLILVPFITAASISLLLPTALDTKEANTLVLSLLIFILSWSLLLTWVYMKEQRAFALGLLTCTSIISFSTVYFTTIKL